MITAAQEFDTYNIIKRFAENPNRISNRLAYNLLIKRTIVKVALNNALPIGETLGEISSFYLNAQTPIYNKSVSVSEKLSDMSVEERRDFYKKACSSVGINVIDPVTYVKDN